MQKTEIPIRADDPLHILLWSIDEMVPMLLGLGMGMMMGQALLFFLIGWVIASLYRRFRDHHADGYLEHLAYHALGLARAPSMVNPYIKRFFP